MRRRTLLTGIGAASTSCLGRPLASDPGTPTDGRSTEGTTSDRPSAERPTSKSAHPTIVELTTDCPTSGNDTTSSGAGVRIPEISVGVDEPENDVHLEVEVKRRFTDEHPAEIAVTLGNDAEELREFSYGPRPLAHGYHIDNDASLMADWRESASNSPPGSDDCWRSESVLIAEPILMIEELRSGETATERYILLAPKDAEKCMPRGVYRFSATIEVGQSSDEMSAIELEWALCLQ